jgi:hypothetical protein
LKEGEHQVFNIDLLIAVPGGQSLGIAHRLLSLFGETIHVHLVL